MDSLPCEVVSDEEWLGPPEGDQARPACFGVGQLRMPARSESDRLCSACMSLGRQTSTYWEEIDDFREVIVDHHHSFDALLKSARGGCHLCALLLITWEQVCRLYQEPGGGWVGERAEGSVSLNEGIRLKFQKRKQYLAWTIVRVDEIHITIQCGKMEPSRPGRLICKAMDKDHLDLPNTCLPSRDDTNTGSTASLSRIKAWMDICSSSHPACSQVGSQPPPLPTRVIAVGSKGSSKCYLVSGNKKNGYYATLSHCWGDPRNRPLSTTELTLPCRQQGIDDEALPKTFRHAVQICREMGIEYIWIDSLCILQEQATQEDWAKEAPRMGHVYGNSILTISAAAAADSTQGCFEDRLGLILWPCPTVLFGQTCYLFRYPKHQEEVYGDPENSHEDKSNVLARRAWVLQEQILSRRSIIFSKTRLIWRCRTLSTNEKYPLGMPRVPNISVDNSRLLHCIVNGITSLIPKEPAPDVYTCWYRTVAEFTFRNLTYEEDRLPAIAGIAKRFGMAVNDSYHAGLWRHDILRGLLWVARSIDICTAKSDRAPSWSWASVNRGVSYSYLFPADPFATRIPLSPLIDILNVLDPPTSEDHPFGVTSRASLSLSGVLLAVMQDEHEASGLLPVVSGTFSVHDVEYFSFDDGNSDRPDQAPLFCLPVCVRHGPYNSDMDDDGHREKASWKGSLETGIDEFGAFNTLYCLVLQAIKGTQDTYRRVGLCRVGNHETIEISRMALFGTRRSIILI